MGLRVHMDGARFANAVAGLGLSPADVSWRAGVDVLCFGGTKMGLPVGEAVVCSSTAAWPRTSPTAANRPDNWRRRCASSRHRGWEFSTNGAWLRHAAHANAMARRLAGGSGRRRPDGRRSFPVQANGVFVRLPDPHR
jgi:threonine aldolase